jgi:hypothetical protein
MAFLQISLALDINQQNRIKVCGSHCQGHRTEESLYQLEKQSVCFSHEGSQTFPMSTGVRSCYDEGKRTAETLAMDYHRGDSVNVCFHLIS